MESHTVLDMPIGAIYLFYALRCPFQYRLGPSPWLVCASISSLKMRNRASACRHHHWGSVCTRCLGVHIPCPNIWKRNQVNPSNCYRSLGLLWLCECRVYTGHLLRWRPLIASELLAVQHEHHESRAFMSTWRLHWGYRRQIPS